MSKIKFEIADLKKGEILGFKGFSGDELDYKLDDKIKEEKQWSGLYLGTKKEQCEGYMVEIDEKGRVINKMASLFEVRACKDFKILIFSDANKEDNFLGSEQITGEDKAKEIRKILKDKNFFNEKENIPLIISIGKNNHIYKGPEYKENDQYVDEIIIPWNMAENFEYRKIKQYKIEKGSLSEEKILENEPWTSFKKAPNASISANTVSQLNSQNIDNSVFV